ncbi:MULTISPECIES: AbrB/MazE/SpoVT family DNA-binding domain-containing protein [unclassified Aureimonas]|uniref:AbrB/MazE/SpoVT family DNA-binding domain-containing protein n=1 Tax=unclassified Aureimonas TaxID=2615206 RepID=UPI0006F9C4B8|nr:MULTISPECIES: AbrB/MazE/SpoVT family DNA-binding domain-containing protein [unclassified Aureimonas]KQT52875.1 hypothetical protein ASG62_13235 [Aureimonas sp. Leaf427]KQT80334.1 hypothetical protein ASG54_07085 [Aureimonas sp. Leaf460]
MTIRVRLSETGEIAIPKDVRDAHRWEAGTEFEVLSEGEKVVLRPVPADDPSERSDEEKKAAIEAFLAARIRYTGPPVTQEMMDATVLDEAARRWHAKNR